MRPNPKFGFSMPMHSVMQTSITKVDQSNEEDISLLMYNAKIDLFNSICSLQKTVSINRSNISEAIRGARKLPTGRTKEHQATLKEHITLLKDARRETDITIGILEKAALAINKDDIVHAQLYHDAAKERYLT